MPIFQDGNGLAVKFFIQKDLPQEVQAELCETITSLGGRVEAKVPRQGYILVRPGSAEEERLRLCWTSSDRPDRFFVPYSYIEACKIAGMLLKQIFVENGGPIPMHIHASIANPNARQALSSRIMHSGGDPHASAQSARVILADPNTDVFHHLVKTHQGATDKHIESYLWVKKCIEKGALVYTPMVYKNPGGRRPGEERTQFTDDDEEHLCDWIAAKIPYKETGGRTGNRLYQQLCDLAGDPEYAWVARHTWQSWRERYKKNAVRLDRMIARIVEQTKPMLGEKGQYGYVRQAEEKPRRSKRKKRSPEPLQDVDDLVSVPPTPGPSGHQHMQQVDPSQVNPYNPYAISLTDAGNTYPAVMPEPSAAPLDQSAVKTSPDEEEMDEEGTEWAVRIGNAAPPAWAKRKATDDDHEDGVNKRQRVENEPNPHGLHTVHSQHPPSPPSIPTDALVVIANMHVLDQSLREIAKETRFTFEEVQEYYNKCADVDTTGARFRRMREQLNSFNDDLG